MLPDVQEATSRIVRTPLEGGYGDVMGDASRLQIGVHEHGLVSLVDVMPRLVPIGQTADFAIVQAARVSYGEGTKQISEDRGLIRYLVRHRHTTPLEMVEFKFHQIMPIFIARQWIRHRTASVNEYSARYSVVKDRFYRPSADSVQQQSTTNKQGGDQQVDALTGDEFVKYLDNAEAQYAGYQKLLDKGVSRELARIGLPLNVYTEWYWKIDLHNLFHFLSLRMDPHAQQEIRDYAYAMFALVRLVVPVACEAFLDYNFHAMKLSRLEVEALRNGAPLRTDNSREVSEWEAKKQRLGRGITTV